MTRTEMFIFDVDVTQNVLDHMFYTENVTVHTERKDTFDVMTILQGLIAVVGIISNFIVVLALLCEKKLRIKIPNIFIINQVGYSVT